ncbi:hupL element site-specific recombinase XisC [Calothrix parasitica NIES-267]|uniref:HupL element site-specific recombinase XisC n=1 Tax=Calothrix parasitica NIES-267 TaxID=1973488 RepID=A0A1Z4LXH8_9CYAN|nr:hupL element site-specific recombinase XisC [Calothrix parasitica NIES-267]
MKEIQDKVFSDFEVPSTSDGTYRGMKNISDETKKHFDMKFAEELLEVNQRLKASKIKVTLSVTGGAIQLVATLPLKPGDTHKQGKDKKQYKISLGISASFDGLKTAEEEAHQLGKLMARHIFQWTDKYLGQQALKSRNITYDEFYSQLEDRYFSKRKKTLKSEHTFHSLRYSFHKALIGDEIINADTLKKRILSTQEPYTRNKTIRAVDFICNELQIEANFNDLKLKQKPKQRDIPSDSVIAKSILLFDERIKVISRYGSKTVPKNRAMKFIYKLLAIYGLRPREIINHPDLHWLMSSENNYNTFKVHESNKTGYREVFPFVPEWIELFDIKNDFEGYIALKSFSQWNSERQLTDKVSAISKYFSSTKIPFVPYDLRHACAIRAQLQGVPIKAAADNLGHTVEEHTKTYQRWFSLENRRTAFNQTFEDINEIDKLRNEIAALRKTNLELELELTRLRLSMQMK